MPSMSYFAYFAPFVSSDEEVWEYQNSVDEKIREFVKDTLTVGLRRGFHYSLTPLSDADISDIIGAEDHRYPSMVPIVEIGFRNKNNLDRALSAGFVRDADGSEEEKPIWG